MNHMWFLIQLTMLPIANIFAVMNLSTIQCNSQEIIDYLYISFK